jgi:hypothetical protein
MALNQSQPLPPLNGTGTSANKTTSIPFFPQSRQQRAAAGDGGQDGNSRFYSSYGDGSGAEPTIRGYSGVEAYPGKKKKDNKGGKLKKGRWYDVGGLWWIVELAWVGDDKKRRLVGMRRSGDEVEQEEGVSKWIWRWTVRLGICFAGDESEVELVHSSGIRWIGWILWFKMADNQATVEYWMSLACLLACLLP